ncbi:unnamed protein product, partial [Prorocentrum cordatum]
AALRALLGAVAAPGGAAGAGAAAERAGGGQVDGARRWLPGVRRRHPTLRQDAVQAARPLSGPVHARGGVRQDMQGPVASGQPA